MTNDDRPVRRAAEHPQITLSTGHVWCSLCGIPWPCPEERAARAEARAERLAAALAYYADEDAWDRTVVEDNDVWGEHTIVHRHTMLTDRGSIARQALAEWHDGA